MSIAKYIDYTLLKANATSSQVTQMCREARDYSFASICIQPIFVKLCSELLTGSDVGVTTVVGFPFGATKPVVKAFEAVQALEDGASEIDMVMNIGGLLAGDLKAVGEDIGAVVSAVDGRGIIKVIIETAYLSKEQIGTASVIVRESGAQFVKTSTGYAPSGAKTEDIQAIRAIVGPGFGIKAAGGIGDYSIAKAMLEAGATRIGASAAVKIVQQETGAED